MLLRLYIKEVPRVRANICQRRNGLLQHVISYQVPGTFLRILLLYIAQQLIMFILYFEVSYPVLVS